MKHPLPDPALDDRLAFRGMTGSSRNLWCRHLRRAHPGEARPRPGSVGPAKAFPTAAASPFDIIIFGGPTSDHAAGRCDRRGDCPNRNRNRRHHGTIL
jgi:hypothetical protein